MVRRYSHRMFERLSAVVDKELEVILWVMAVELKEILTEIIRIIIIIIGELAITCWTVV